MTKKLVVYFPGNNFFKNKKSSDFLRIIQKVLEDVLRILQELPGQGSRVLRKQMQLIPLVSGYAISVLGGRCGTYSCGISHGRLLLDNVVFLLENCYWYFDVPLWCG